jgi:hypothetical protein
MCWGCQARQRRTLIHVVIAVLGGHRKERISREITKLIGARRMCYAVDWNNRGTHEGLGL